MIAFPRHAGDRRTPGRSITVPSYGQRHGTGGPPPTPRLGRGGIGDARAFKQSTTGHTGRQTHSIMVDAKRSAPSVGFSATHSPASRGGRTISGHTADCTSGTFLTTAALYETMGTNPNPSPTRVVTPA